MEIERMQDFFVARIDAYEEHMLCDVGGCGEGYKKMAELLPRGIKTLLDLGCGTGLELEEIFNVNPHIHVTGIDLTLEMLDRMIQKYTGKNITPIHASYFDVDFGFEQYDAAVSFETLHHFPKEKKLGLYGRLCRALKPGGLYIECDYMADSQQDEDFFFSENNRIRAELGIPDGAYYHVDTPCTIENQQLMLVSSGFASADMVWRVESTVILVARK